MTFTLLFALPAPGATRNPTSGPRVSPADLRAAIT